MTAFQEDFLQTIVNVGWRTSDSVYVVCHASGGLVPWIGAANFFGSHMLTPQGGFGGVDFFDRTQLINTTPFTVEHRNLMQYSIKSLYLEAPIPVFISINIDGVYNTRDVAGLPIGAIAETAFTIYLFDGPPINKLDPTNLMFNVSNKKTGGPPTPIIGGYDITGGNNSGSGTASFSGVSRSVVSGPNKTLITFGTINIVMKSRTNIGYYLS
jgi:hypothetical protein